MPSTINATTSGIVTTGDSVATLSLQTGGNTAVAIDTSQNVTLAKSLIISGSTSGNVTFTANAISGTQSYTLPPALPASSGYALTSTTGGVMTWAASGGGSPGGSTTQVQYNNSGAFGGISGFTTDGTRVTASTTMAVGGATPSTSGSGITFPATQSASTDVNTLDDYEEGTFTPTLGGTATYTTQIGTYTKVGRLVCIKINLTVLVLGTGSTQVISGLPFNVSGTNYAGQGAVLWTSLAISPVSVTANLDSGTSTIRFSASTAASASQTENAAIFGNSAGVSFSLFYITT